MSHGRAAQRLPGACQWRPRWWSMQQEYRFVTAVAARGQGGPAVATSCSSRWACTAGPGSGGAGRGRAADPVLLVMPASHGRDLAGFQRAIDAGIPAALETAPWYKSSRPTPGTGYGYIRCGCRAARQGQGHYRLRRKPDAATAQRYLDSGECRNGTAASS